MYNSDSESEVEVTQDYDKDDIVTINTHPQQSTPVKHRMPRSSTPHTEEYVSPKSFEPLQHRFGAAPIMPSSLSRVAPKLQKNIAQSSLPCVWSYSNECAPGIAPHYTSSFFLRLRERKELQSRRKRGLHYNALGSYQSSLKFQSQSEHPTIKRESKEDEQGRRHSLYNQFVLNKHRPLQDTSQTRPSRRAQAKIQGKIPLL
jgi:hypothetical protein